MRGAGEFDPAAVITATSVNPWPHSRAPEHNALWAAERAEAEQP